MEFCPWSSKIHRHYKFLKAYKRKGKKEKKEISLETGLFPRKSEVESEVNTLSRIVEEFKTNTENGNVPVNERKLQVKVIDDKLMLVFGNITIEIKG